MHHIPDTALILSVSNHDYQNNNVRGTGGWISPREREGLDWMVLIRFLGWRVELKTLEEFNGALVVQLNVKWIIFTGDPDEVSPESWTKISQTLNFHRIMFVSQAGKQNGKFSEYTGIHINDVIQSGSLLSWMELPKKRWQCRNNVQMSTLSWQKDFYASATLMGEPLIATKALGIGKIVMLSFHPGEARDQEGAFTALLKHLLIYASLVPVAWFDWKNTVILRMDDPGSMEVVYHDAYRHRKLSETEWSVMGDELEQRNGRMSIGYVPGWVDDGNPEKGELFVKGELVSRTKGNVYPSPTIRYVSTNHPEGDIDYNYVAEFMCIQNLRKKGVAEVELHGYTHLTPDRNSWVNATDRYSNIEWYREFAERDVKFLQKNPILEHPLDAGLKMLSSYYATFPSTLICPGDEFTNEVIERCLEAGMMMISSYYLAIKIGAQMCWGMHVCAPYLDKPDPAWFDSELPVVGYFHDTDISQYGIAWFSNCLKGWEAVGARHFVDFREVESRLNRYTVISKYDGTLALRTEVIKACKLIKPICINVFDPEVKLEKTTDIDKDGYVYTI